MEIHYFTLLAGMTKKEFQPQTNKNKSKNTSF
jgi:hypothetical protein